MPVLDTIFITLLIVIGMSMLAFLILWALYVFSFKHHIRIKEVVNGRKIIHDDKFKIKVDPDGTAWFRLKKFRALIPQAPEEAIELDSKGRKVVEAYKLSSGEYIYAKDISEPLPEDIDSITDQEKREKRIKEWTKSRTAVDAYQPLTTKQRVILISQIKKAQGRRKKSWKEQLPMLVGLGALVILVVSLMIFYGDIAKPTLIMADKVLESKKIDTEQLEILGEIKNDIQQIHEEKSIKKTGRPPN